MPGPVAPGIGMGAGIGLGPTTPGCKVPEPEAVMPMEGFMMDGEAIATGRAGMIPGEPLGIRGPIGGGAVIGRMVGATGPGCSCCCGKPPVPGIAGDGMVGRGAVTGPPDIGITPPPLMRVMGPFPMYPPMRLSRILRLAMA